MEVLGEACNLQCTLHCSTPGILLAGDFPGFLEHSIEHSQVCSFADDNTIFACSDTLDEVAICIENDMKMPMNWFNLNEMVANPEKFHLIFFGIKEDHELSIEIIGDVIIMSDTVKLLGLTIDFKIKFNEHVKTICQKTNNKVKAFSSVVRYLEPQKASLLYNSFILTNFNYCSLIWMFCGQAIESTMSTSVS